MVAPLAAAAGESVLRIVTHGSEASMKALVGAVEAIAPGVRGFVQREMAVPGHRAEFLSRRADKWQGIQAIARRHGIGPAAIVAVGDDANDVEMLSGAGHSLAAPGAAAVAQAAAKERLAGDGPRAVVAALRRLFPRGGKDSAGVDC
jgi:phosphoglycolate phosphatase-like HAD superfamily hydrolase